MGGLRPSGSSVSFLRHSAACGFLLRTADTASSLAEKLFKIICKPSLLRKCLQIAFRIERWHYLFPSRLIVCGKVSRLHMRTRRALLKGGRMWMEYGWRPVPALSRVGKHMCSIINGACNLNGFPVFCLDREWRIPSTKSLFHKCYSCLFVCLFD